MKLLKTIKNIFKETPRFPDITDWHSAGILFISNNTALIGYKIINESWIVSGFGGKKEEGELYYQTAIRETLEELYEVPITKEVIEYVANRINVKKIVNNDGYVLMICETKQINKFILAGIHFVFDSLMYDSLPYSVLSLIGKRNEISDSEYPFIGFLPMSMILSDSSPLKIDPNLISDMKYVIEENKDCEK
jgi:hypothetical protein